MPQQPEVRVRRLLANILPRGFDVKVTPSARSSERTFAIDVIGGTQSHRFVAAWAGEGWPADVERQTAIKPRPDVITARRISEGARSALSDMGIGWADESGRAEINRPSGLVIVREATPDESPRETPTRWTASMLAVAETTLSGTTPTVARVEETTKLSRNGTALALNRLEKLGLLERPNARRGRSSGRRVVDRDAFLDAYAAAAAQARAKQPVVRIHALWKDPLDDFTSHTAPRLARTKHAWALTGAAAGQLLAPYLSTLTVVELYVDADLLTNQSLLAETVGGRVVEKGHRLEVRELPTTISATGPVLDAVRVALPVRVYADLLAVGGRSADAAQHLRETLHAGTAA